MRSPIPDKDDAHLVSDTVQDRLDGSEASAGRIECRTCSDSELQEVRRMKVVAVEAEDYENAARLKSREMELMQSFAMQNENAGTISLDVDNSHGFAQPLAELKQHDRFLLMCRERAYAVAQARTHAILFEHWMQRAFPDGNPFTAGEILHDSAVSTAGCLEDGTHAESTQFSQPASSSDQNVTNTHIRLQFTEAMDEENHKRTGEPSDIVDEREETRKDSETHLVSKASKDALDEESVDCDNILSNVKDFEQKKRKKRTGSQKRDRNQRLDVDRLKEVVHEDPEGADYKLNSASLPSTIETGRVLRQKLQKRLLADTASIQQESRAARNRHPLTHQQHQFTERAGQPQSSVATYQSVRRITSYDVSHTSCYHSGSSSHGPPQSLLGSSPHGPPQSYVATYWPGQGPVGGLGSELVGGRVAMPAQWAPSDWYLAAWQQAAYRQTQSAAAWHPTAFRDDVWWVTPVPQHPFPFHAYQPGPSPLHLYQQSNPGDPQGVVGTCGAEPTGVSTPPGLREPDDSNVRRFDGDVPASVRWLGGFDDED